MKPAHLVIVALAAAGGWYASRLWPVSAPTNIPGARKILIYQSPMHPWVKSDKPGQCTVCGMDLVPVYEVGAGFDKATAGRVMLPSGSPDVVGMRTEVVRKQPLARTLRVAGMIGEDESRHGIISAPVEGRIDGLAMTGEGDKVTRRQPLVTLFSRTLLSAASDYKIALEQTSPTADQAKRRLEQYGLVWEQIQAIPQRQADDIHFGILSPLTGTIVKSYVSEGQTIREGDRLFEIADFTKMWFMFTAYEQDLPLLATGQIITVTTPSLPGEILKAKVGFISPNLDETTRSSRIRVVLENPDRRIRNKTFAEGIVELDAPEVIAIPRGAVLWPGGTPRVYVEKAPGVYQQRNVKLGRPGDACWEILGGLKEGERVVLSGNMLIDGQAQLDAMVVAEPAPPDLAISTAANPDLNAYLTAVAALTNALADDDLAAANAALAQLPNAPEGLIKTSAPGPNTDIMAMRKAFLPWSQEIAALAAGMKPQFPGLQIFSCPMTHDLWPGAPADAKWIQAGGELHNPYWGKQMRDCGVEVKP